MQEQSLDAVHQDDERILREQGRKSGRVIPPLFLPAEKQKGPQMRAFCIRAK